MPGCERGALPQALAVPARACGSRVMAPSVPPSPSLVELAASARIHLSVPFLYAVEGSVAEDDEQDLITRLGKSRIFQDLSQEELKLVAQTMDQNHYKDGQRILKEGEEGMGFFFVVLDGKATVVQHGKQLATLKQGEFFGEITSLNGGPRTASVTAETPLWTVGLMDWNFRPFLEAFPKVTFRILEEVCRRYQAVATNAR